MQRMAMLIGIDPSRIAEHKALHAAVWPAAGEHWAMMPMVFHTD